ncbi:MAG: hypothetical protein FJZ56_05800 [Chlamydiae bacterium]|nr:hypothetical protein [Chlamydiota bacterium]
MKRFLFLASLSLFFISVEILTPFKTDGLVAISEEKVENFDFEKIRDIVEKPLRYVGSGNEAIVFGSADDQYVIKFFSKKKFSEKFRLKFKPWMRNFLKSKADKKVKKTIEETLSRYEEGLQLLPEETALVALHRYRSVEELPTCTLLDYQGKVHHIDLGEYVFVVQKKCQIITRKEILKDRAKFDSAFEELFKNMASRGFVNLSKGFHLPNFGIFEGKAVMIDLGNLSYKPNCPHEIEYEKLLNRYFKVIDKKAALKNDPSKTL